MNIHPSSVISKQAEIADDVVIGPFCVVTGQVRIGAGTKLISHVSIGSDYGVVEIGQNNTFFAGAVIGGPPQDLKYKGEETRLEIGDHNMIRELTTLNLGTVTGGGVTKIGSHNLIMAYSHLGHDCHLGSHIVIANSGQLAGHVIVEDHAKINGICGFNQFVRVGKHSFVAAYSAVNKDILPFTIAHGDHAVTRATNRVGLERAGFTKDEIDGINRAVRIITKGGHTMDEALERIERECPKTEPLDYFINFIRQSERGVAI
jgi:UDP-N-acetylglucosamine acyltransferase